MSNVIGGRNSSAALDFGDLVDIAREKSKRGRRASGRRAPLRERLEQASILAPLLAAEGCKTVSGGRDSPLQSGGDDGHAPSGGGAPIPSVSAILAEDDGNFQTAVDSSIMIAAEDLIENDAVPSGASAQVVRVFGASHGAVMMHNGAIHFTPEAGYQGMATFTYEVRDSRGNLSQAQVEVMVGGAAGGHDHGSGAGGGGSSGHDHTDGSMPHPDDPAKMAEHMAVLDLVPISQATHVAINNGSWFDPNTWANGQVPGAGAKVVIPEGVEVAYDGESAVSLFTVRVDGVLEFATDRDTFMEVDTFIVTPSGRVSIGTADNPVAANVETVIQIADNGPINVAWDPMLLSRGVVSHGEFEVYGAEKDPFLKVAIDPMRGATSMTLEAPPEGWQVGDQLVITGTHLTKSQSVPAGTPRNDTTEDEEITITRIEGNVIYFDKPLAFDHESPRADLKAYVANYTRNVRFTTENADDIPVYQRGHVMLMHSDNIDVRYAEFQDLGRTDKSRRAFDVGDLDHVESDSNVKGRYSLHIHRAGLEDPDDPAILVGNSVWGSPGWGFVHHDSNALLTDNAAYDVFGAAFVAETGNEIGRWSHNIAIKSIGTGGGAKWHEDVAAFDLGRTGAGFWFQGRLVAAVDNVAAGVPGGQGFIYMSRGNDVIKVDPDTADFSESLRYVKEAYVNYPALAQFQNNESIAVNTGVEIIKAGSEQFHDVRSIIDGFTAWEVKSGIHLQYTAHYTLSNIDVVATDRSGGAGAPSSGIEYGPNTIDMVIHGATITGFPNGFHASRDANNLNYPFDGNWGYIFIDVNVIGATTKFANPHSSDRFYTPDDITEGRLDFHSNIVGIPATPTPESHAWLTLSGTKTDSLGDMVVSPTWDPIRYNYFNIAGAVAKEGYWTLPDGRTVTILDQYYADRLTGEVEKVGVFVEWTRPIGNATPNPVYNGVLDLSSDAPVGRTDFATVDKNGTININVLLNDYDPDGDDLSIDGLVHATHGSVYDNKDGTIKYIADPNYVGVDEFWYWVDDGNGNYDKTRVQVTVEI